MFKKIKDWLFPKEDRSKIEHDARIAGLLGIKGEIKIKRK